MSNPVSALLNASDDSGMVALTELGPTGMITLRGDLSAKELAKAVTTLFGVGMPERGRAITDGLNGVAWMSPDELLLLCPYGEVHTRLEALSDKLAGQHALAVNVSDARALFEIKGAHVRDVVAKLAPVDMHKAFFVPGMFRRTRFAQVPAAFWMPEEEHARVICFRSVAQYMFDLLKMAAQPGSEVGHH